MILRSFFMTVIASAITLHVQAQFKVVGYIRSNGDITGDMRKVDLNRITHLNIAFINPEPDGHFKEMPVLDSVISIAHAHNIKVLMSCGGGSRHEYYAKLLADPMREQVVNNFIAFVDKYQLDGVDVDIEGDDIDSNYENFVVALGKPLRSRNKLLTAALAYYTRTKITNKALQQFDFINMMAYDKTGPWRLTDPTQHSPMSYAEDHLNYWRGERGVAKSKLVIGVPFYGYGFGATPDTNKAFRSMSYKDIITQFPGAETKDEVTLPDNGGTVFYNGIPTIRRKAQLAAKKAGGVMIWQLLHDSNDDLSLLKVIDETAKK